MNTMIKREKANIRKIKQKQKQSIEFMIEQQMKAELINYRNLEKDKKVKENKEKKKKEIHEKSIKNQRIQEEMKLKRLNNDEFLIAFKRTGIKLESNTNFIFWIKLEFFRRRNILFINK